MTISAAPLPLSTPKSVEDDTATVTLHTNGAALGPTEHSEHSLLDIRHHYRRRVSKRPDTRMVPGMIRYEGRRVRFAVSDNEGACGLRGRSEPVWAVNIHGYFAGGGMYWRESARLAQRMGWRVVNPSLPGFGGSDPLEWEKINIEELAHQVELVLEHLDAGPAVVLGHSMGGAVAIKYAHLNLSRTLGIIYRDGIATPAWKARHGIVPTILAPILPDVAPMLDLVGSVILDIPDLFVGRLFSTVRSLVPDVRRNVRSIGRTIPVGSMLMTVDLRSEVRELAASGVPMLVEWGCFDRVANAVTAEEFAACANSDIQWLPGGHSWMLARPQGQSDVLTLMPTGKEFISLLEERLAKLSDLDEVSRPPGSIAQIG